MFDLLPPEGPARRLYAALLRRPEASMENLRVAAELSPGELRSGMEQLRGRGLVRSSADGRRLVPERPDLVAGPGLDAAQQELTARSDELARARREVTDLVELYVAGRTTASTPVEVERVEGRESLAGRMDEIMNGARQESLTIGVSTGTTPQDVVAHREVDRRTWAQGARSRTIQPVDMRQVDHLTAYALEASQHGDEYRVMPKPPMTLFVVDARVGLVPIDQDDLDRGAYVVWSPAVVRAFVALFELAWEAAVPLFSNRLGDDDDALALRDRQLLELLAAGAKDEVAARRLGLGLRTVRRDIARLMEELGADTRLQAGVLAARRGWL